MTFPPMRPQVEVQRVHDLLMDVLSDRQLAVTVIPHLYVGPLMLVADCLCWLLHHDLDSHPDSYAGHFANLIGYLEEDLAKLGHTWESRGEYIVDEEG